MKSNYSERIKINSLVKILIFISGTFILSWGLDWCLIKAGGLEVIKNTGSISPGMLAPAFVAMVLEIFIFRGSKIYYRHYKETPRWIFYSFFILFLSFIIINFVALKYPDYNILFIGLGTVLITFWTLAVLIIRGQSSSEAFKRLGLNFDNIGKGIPFIIGVVIFFAISAVLNLLLGLGNLQPRSTTIYGIPAGHSFYIPLLIILFVTIALLGGPLSSLALYFGEEYGWRAFLQKELFRYNTIFGALLIGLIWGAWHIPLIIRGIHTYPPDTPGIIAGLVFFTLWGVIQSYSVLKTGSIWVAAFLHGSVNYIYSFLITNVIHPHDNLKSFGLGIYGIIILAIIVIVILFDPVWKSRIRPDKT